MKITRRRNPQMPRAARLVQTAPFRQERVPEPLPLPSGLAPLQVAAAVAARIHEIARARSCCGYVFVRQGKVYVISEESAMAQRWASRFVSEWVGCYGGSPDLDGIVADMEGML